MTTESIALLNSAKTTGDFMYQNNVSTNLDSLEQNVGSQIVDDFAIASKSAQKRAWVAPRIVCLDTSDTLNTVTGGSDGGHIGTTLT